MWELYALVVAYLLWVKLQGIEVELNRIANDLEKHPLNIQEV